MTSYSLSDDARMSDESRPILGLLTTSAAASIVDPTTTPWHPSGSYRLAAAEYQTTLPQPSSASTSYTEPTGNQKIIIGTLATATILILIALGAALLQWQLARRRKALQPNRLRHKASFEDPFALVTSGEYEVGATADRPKLDRFPGAFAVKDAHGGLLKVDWQDNVNAPKAGQSQRRGNGNDRDSGRIRTKPLHDARSIRNNNGPSRIDEHHYDHDTEQGHGRNSDHKSRSENSGGPLTSHPITPHFSLLTPQTPFCDHKDGDQTRLEPIDLHHYSKSQVPELQLQLRTPSTYDESIDRQQVYGSMPAMGSGSLTSPSGSESETESECEDIATMTPSSPNHRKSPAPRGILKKSPSPTSPDQAGVKEGEKAKEGPDYGFPSIAETVQPPTSPGRRKALKSALKRVLSPAKKRDGVGEASKANQQPQSQEIETKNEQRVENIRPRPQRKSVSFGDVQVRRVVQSMEEEDGGWETVDSEGSDDGNSRKGKAVRK